MGRYNSKKAFYLHGICLFMQKTPAKLLELSILSKVAKHKHQFNKILIDFSFQKDKYILKLPFESTYMRYSCAVCQGALVMSDSLRPCGLQHARLLCSQISPGNSIGVGCRVLLPYEVPRLVKFTKNETSPSQTQSRTVVSRDWVEGGRRSTVSAWDNEKILEMDSGDSCTTM